MQTQKCKCRCPYVTPPTHIGEGNRYYPHTTSHLSRETASFSRCSPPPPPRHDSFIYLYLGRIFAIDLILTSRVAKLSAFATSLPLHPLGLSQVNQLSLLPCIKCDAWKRDALLDGFCFVFIFPSLCSAHDPPNWQEIKSCKSMSACNSDIEWTGARIEMMQNSQLDFVSSLTLLSCNLPDPPSNEKSVFFSYSLPSL